MMKKVYCPDCGTRMEYAAKMPNFCINCGFALSKAAGSRSTGPEGDHGETGRYEEAVEGESYEFSADVIEKIAGDVEIIMDQGGGTKMGDLVGTRPEGQGELPPLKGKKRGRPKSKKRVREDFSREAGSIKENKPKKE